MCLLRACCFLFSFASASLRQKEVGGFVKCGLFVYVSYLKVVLFTLYNIYFLCVAVWRRLIRSYNFSSKKNNNNILLNF